MSLIKIENIKKVYNIGKKNECNALRGVDLEITAGELVAIIGVSGSGKSTLLHILGCVDTPTEGEYFLNNEKVDFNDLSNLATLRNEKIGFVLQDFGLILNDTVLENVTVPLLFSNRSFLGIRDKAINALKLTGVADLAKKKAGQLSGGQKQRVAIARALANDPDIILADEPTGSLDSKTSADIMELFKKLNSEGKTIIIVTHNNEVAKQCKRVIEISDGAII